MNIINKFSMNMMACSANESFARAAISAFALQLDPTIEDISDIKTAVSEAVTNCIVHAYKEKSGKIYITAEICANFSIRIKIKDRGCGIEEIDKAMQPLFSSIGDERAGLGFSVMQSFMDKISVRSRVGYGTTVTLIKNISPKYTR